ncbi:NAD(P)/FAD-dependent oxidoreductase [Luteipulveratus flavus]|uniref:NAD(P)/FAD-dependent oxidoreductase n=1 Tax=Luteipulveratus flavus TaxID=3031728 RepID=A0ABT6CBP4_9MICO|nr:NAD(P)/FAD-dependent oxidoreductase [Luteipulveratus sp. YIM 133296]MDF8266325.1 NAD(P)/FAD-dependent oxidoreductase [Luteipulveratus sp. YIM 133296]
MSTDVVVVGGGPVGLGTAVYAARAGLTTTVLEPRDGDVDKACGEGLMPGGLAALAGLGIEPPGYPLTGITYLAPGVRASAAFRSGPGRGVRRTVLHRALRTAALASGVELRSCAASDITAEADRVVVSCGDGSTLSAGHLIAADGLHSPTRRRLGLDRPADRRPRFGQRRHFRVRPWSDRVEVHWGRSAEAYVTPVAEDLVGVAVLTGERASYDTHLRQFPELVARLDGAEPATDVRGAGPLRQRAAAPVRGRVMLVGDASGYVDALTGEGISLGLAHGRAAVDAIVSGRPESYASAWRAVNRVPFAATGLLLRATEPAWIRKRIVPAAATLPWLFGAALHRLEGAS